MDKTNLFGITTFRDKKIKFGIKNADRRQHMYVIGKTGVGKTALLKNLALQDIKNGKGVAIVDPHGEFVEEVLESVPPGRTNDVVYFNPADTGYPISFNILDVPDPEYKHLINSGLMGVFTKIWANVWSARMEYILANCILALLDTPGTTLLGIPRILVDRDYRQKIINNIKDPVVKSFWVNEYEEWSPKYRNEAIAPIQNKVGQFLNVSLIRNIVGQPKSSLDLEKIMNEEKILLVNVSKGRIGEDNSALLGSILITKIQLAAMERVRIPEKERKDFYLYVDEFQNFVTEAFANILSEARKYRLNLILAHQYIGQLLTDDSEEVRDAVFGNVGTLISFRVGAADAEFLEKEFEPEFYPDDLVNLPNYNIYLKLMINGVTSRPFSAKTIPPIEVDKKPDNREKIIRVSRERYSNSREEVEEKISRWSGTLEFPERPKPSSENLHDAVCSSCGKDTKVPFKPEKGKNVYCKNCLKKIKEGSKEPPQSNSSSKGKKVEKEVEKEELKELGIEFESSENISEEKQKSQKTFPKKKKEDSQKFSQPSSRASLKEDLSDKTVYFSPSKKRREEREKKRKNVNIPELKKVLKDSLVDSNRFEEETETPKQETPKQETPDQEDPKKEISKENHKSEELSDDKESKSNKKTKESAKTSERSNKEKPKTGEIKPGEEIEF